jgi:hypothetical protein
MTVLTSSTVPISLLNQYGNLTGSMAEYKTNVEAIYFGKLF